MITMSESITITVSRELKDRIDVLRGEIPRSRFLSKLIKNVIHSGEPT